jgi:death-on-curing protein
MENISYHLAAGRIDKDLLRRLIQSIIDGEPDFPESLKLEYALASAGPVGFSE